MLDDDFSRARPVPQPAASCLLLRRSVLHDDHILDERYPIFFNDVQLARSLAERQLTLWVTPEATVVHEAHASTRMLGGTGKQQYLGSTVRMLKETESPANVWLFRFVVFAQHIPMWALVRAEHHWRQAVVERPFGRRRPTSDSQGGHDLMGRYRYASRRPSPARASVQL